MEIHRFEKVWLGASLLLIVGFIATIVYGAVGPGVAMVSDSGGTVDATDPTASPEFREPGVYQTGPGEYEVYVVARQFAFEPGSDDPVRVPADSTVTLHVASADVIHGFALAGTNVNVMVIPGQVSEITVEFDEPGEHGIVCNEYCGGGHHTMAGEFVVVPAAQYDASASAEVSGE